MSPRTWHSVWLAFALTSAALAESPPAAPMLGQVTRSGYVSFRITSGRVLASARQIGNISSTTSDGRQTEKLSVQNTGGDISLTYERFSAAEDFSVHVTAGNRIHIGRTGKTGAAIVPVQFDQAAGEPVSLTVGPTEHADVYRAASLWHLLLAQPEECRTHLIPLLEVLRPEWRLAEMSRALEVELLRAAEGGLPDQRQWATLVEQLGDEQFAKREAADRQLRRAGQSVVGYLRQLDFDRLDAEQQLRVRRILASLAGRSADDTVERIVPTMVCDRTVWLAMLSRPEEPTRRLAARQLAAILDKPISFDPTAVPDTRKEQIEKLRAEIGD